MLALLRDGDGVGYTWVQLNVYVDPRRAIYRARVGVSIARATQSWQCIGQYEQIVLKRGKLTIFDVPLCTVRLDIRLDILSRFSLHSECQRSSVNPVGQVLSEFKSPRVPRHKEENSKLQRNEGRVGTRKAVLLAESLWGASLTREKPRRTSSASRGDGDLCTLCR